MGSLGVRIWLTPKKVVFFCITTSTPQAIVLGPKDLFSVHPFDSNAKDFVRIRESPPPPRSPLKWCNLVGEVFFPPKIDKEFVIYTCMKMVAKYCITLYFQLMVILVVSVGGLGSNRGTPFILGDPKNPNHRAPNHQLPSGKPT